MSSKICKHCDCTEIDVDQARGDAVCTNCGSVLEDNFIVSEVQFEENARGGSSSIGQFVSLDGGSQRGFAGGLHIGYGQESRQITLENGRKKIVEVAQQLRLNQHCIDTAFNIFKMAVHRRLTRGRRHCNVIAACLYIVCRLEATSHMLLDFCDVLQVNVYDLGKTYLKLSRALCISIPAIDPCLYIIRFAHHLQFGDKTHEVAMTALRLVQRMKRDWMHTGRRPSGLCGAALLVAARLHEFNRTMSDIIKVVKVCTATLRKRLTEFGETPSSRLTLEEFMTIDLEEEQDPPAFKAARKKARIQQLEDQNKVEDATTEITELQKEIERLLEEKNNKLRGMYAKFAATTEEASPKVKEPDNSTDSALKFVEDETIDAITKFITGSESTSDSAINELGVPVDNNSGNGMTSGNKEAISCTPPRPNLRSNGLSSFNWRSPIRGVGPTAASLGITDSLQECLKADSQPAENENGELDLTGLDDEELDCYIMSADEVKRKSELWHNVNADYLKEVKEKEEREAKEREEGVVKPEKKKRKVRKKNPIQANSAGEAIEMMLQEKRISNKINYDVLRNLNMQFGTPLKPSASQGETGSSTPKTVSFSLPVSDTSSRLEDLSPKTNKPLNPNKRVREDDISETPVEKKTMLEATKIPDVVIESGPVSYQPESKDLEMDADYDEEDYDDDDDDDGDQNPGASYVLRQIRGKDEYYDDGDDYYD